MKDLVLSFLIGVCIGLGIALTIIKNSPKYEMQEYQIRLEPNEAYIYDQGKLIGFCPYGSDGIDSVILRDNE